MTKLKLKRLKIVEQIIIVLLFSVIVPMLISWLIINNINQQAVRRELKNSAIITATAIKSSLEALSEENISKLQEISLGLKFIPYKSLRQKYLNEIKEKNESYKSFEIIDLKNSQYQIIQGESFVYDPQSGYMKIAEKLYDNSYLVATIDVTDFENNLFSLLKEDNRQVYIINPRKEVILSHNYNQTDLLQTLAALPKKMESMKPVVFGDNKNQPLVYYKLSQPDILILVDTTEEVTNKTITKYRNRILLAFLITGFAIILIVGLYTSYLYVNIRQLMKGIIGLSKGSFKRKIRLITNFFTPYEVVFLADEFNKMGDDIYQSYKQLKQKNLELKQLDKFRSNLIDTVSHEFRTPLTSIKGYTSRLLRNDIEINEEMKHKSLKVIKRQVERLSAMVEDLLVIPDIEGANLYIKKEELSISEIIETSMLSVSKQTETEFVLNISADIPSAFADKNRLEQVLLNIFENAAKYSYPQTPIEIDVTEEELFINIKVTNQADFIEKEELNSLFEKFTRLDKTREQAINGTGLGLYIVKGLIESMDGFVALKSLKENKFIVKVSIPKFGIYKDPLNYNNNTETQNVYE